MTKPTHQDAMVMLNIMQWAALADLESASRFIWGDKYIKEFEEFVKKYPPGTKEYSRVLRFCGYYETIGTLWKNELLNEDLLFDWLLIKPSWDRVSGFTLGLRAETGEKRMFENFEALAGAQK